MQQRNRLLADGVRDAARFEGLERVMAETGVAIAAARAEAVAALAAIMAERHGARSAFAFPWPRAWRSKGALEADLRTPAGGRGRGRLRAARCATGASATAPPAARSTVRTAPISRRAWPKEMPARLCSTGEQKALLIGLVLAHAELVAAPPRGRRPILLLDEITAHLDAERRAALFDEILRLGTQAWMTGTDAEPSQGSPERPDFGASRRGA